MFKRKLLASATISLALMIGGAAVLLGHSSEVPAQPIKTASVPETPVTTVIERTLARSLEFTGRLAAVETVELRPRVSGYIKAVKAPEGAIVRQGDVLFELDAAPFEAELAAAHARRIEAEARLLLAETELMRAEVLFGKGIVARERVDRAVASKREREAQVASALAAERLAKLQTSYTQIVAPISGRVGRVNATKGNLVFSNANSAPLTTIVTFDSMHVYFDMDEGTYLKSFSALRGSEQRQVHIRLADGSTQSGSLDFVENHLDVQTGTVLVRALVPNPDGRLTPGMFVRAELQVEVPKPATLVHDQAIRTAQGQRYVLVVNASGLVEFRPVTLGEAQGSLRVITSGLRPGEQVVAKGLVGPGMTVRPKLVHSETLLPTSAISG